MFSFPLYTQNQLLCFLLHLSVDEEAKSQAAGKHVLYSLETSQREVRQKDIYRKDIKVRTGRKLLKLNVFKRLHT